MLLQLMKWPLLLIIMDDRTCFLQKSEIPLKILRISTQVRAFHLYVDYNYIR